MCFVGLARVGVIEAVDIAEQHQRVGADQVRHQGREPVVVAEPDFVGGHGVVLVDDRHRVQSTQPVQRALGVGVLHPHRNVMCGQQDLTDAALVAGECATPRVDQRHLSDTCRGLLGGQVGGTFGQPQWLDAGGNGP